VELQAEQELLNLLPEALRADFRAMIDHTLMSATQQQFV
jgi:hypothetical protein